LRRGGRGNGLAELSSVGSQGKAHAGRKTARDGVYLREQWRDQGNAKKTKKRKKQKNGVREVKWLLLRSEIILEVHFMQRMFTSLLNYEWPANQEEGRERERKENEIRTTKFTCVPAAKSIGSRTA